MANQTNVVPLSEDFKKWLVQNNGKGIQENSTASTVSRLNGLFTKVLNPAFNKDIRPFHEILKYLISYDIDKAVDAIAAMSECAFDAKAKGRSVGTDESYNDRRSALNRYKEFLQDLSMDRTTELKNLPMDRTTELKALDKFIDKYAKKVFNAHVVAVDINDDKLALAKECGADIVINGLKENPVEVIKEKTGGCHSAVVTAVSKVAFNQAIDSVRAAGIVVAVGLPSETMDVSIVKTVLDGIEIIGSLVGTRKDLEEAFQFGAEGLVVPVVKKRPIEDAPAIFKEMEDGVITGRMVIDMKM